MAGLSPDCGLFRVVKGKVTFKKKGKDKYKKARINKKICQGDTVKTEDNSRTKIVMADKNELNVSPNTEILIEVYKNSASEKQVLLNVVYGKVRSNVKEKYDNTKKSHYRVKTKSAVAGVRGTEFLASYDLNTNQSRIVTFEGEVAVGKIQGGKFLTNVVVKPGFFTSSGRGDSSPHAPKELPPQEFAQMDKETNVSEPGAGNSQGPRQPSNDKKPQDKKDDPKPKQKAPAPDKKPDPKADIKSPKRDVASIPADPIGDDLLPEPELDLLPEPTPEPPRLPPTVRDITNITQQPVCLTCNDAVINDQKAKVRIIPTIGGVPIN